MVNNDEITAAWARKESISILGEKVQKQMNDSLEAIKNAVKRNEMQANVFIWLDDLTITELNKRGFKVKKINSDSRDPRDSDYYTISW